MTDSFDVVVCNICKLGVIFIAQKCRHMPGCTLRNIAKLVTWPKFDRITIFNIEHHLTTNLLIS